MSSSSPSAPWMPRSRAIRVFAMLALSLSLGACDYISSFTKPKQTPEEAKAEGIALGAGCRQAGQSLEDCYQRNPNSLKAGIFAGWKDMHEYMAAKGIETVPPPPPVVEAKPAVDPDAGKDERTLRREKRERERAEKEGKSSDSKSKDSKSKDSDSPRKSRDDGTSKK